MHYLKQLSLLAVAALALCAASLLQAAEGNEGITAQAFVEAARGPAQELLRAQGAAPLPGAQESGLP